MNMKRTALVLLAAAAVLAAQEADRVTVPFSNPNGSKSVRIETMQGDVVVKTHERNDVIVDTVGGSRRSNKRTPQEMEGLKRIDISGRGITAEESQNTILIKSPFGPGDNLNVWVPSNVTLRVKTLGGDVEVDGVQGELELNTTNGDVHARNVGGSVIGHSLNGDVIVTINRVESKPMSFSTLNGDIDVTLPRDTKARLKLKADHGEVYTDFTMTLEPTQRIEEKSKVDGKVKVRVDKTTYATINGGGPEIAFTTLNGEIKIRQAK
jgi:DUF4097 and DUF4098 domain-containing protein YvlB